jgi:hypothetical protein
MNPLVERWRRLSVHPAIRPFTAWRVYAQWLLCGRPVPAPPIVKQHILKQYQDRFHLQTLVETGTFTGETVEALRGRTARIISIELAPALHAAAVRRFADAPNVSLLHGDSKTLLPSVLQDLTGPVLFWLDGHYTGPGTAGDGLCPLEHEVRALLARPPGGDVILIDDARELTGTRGYPRLDELCADIRRKRPRADVTVRDDIVRWIDRV